MSTEHCPHLPSDTPAALVALGMRAARGLARLMENEQRSIAGAVPRVAMFAQAFDRISRAVQRSVALAHRKQMGWPRAGRPDGRATVRPEVKRSVAQIVRELSESDEAEESLADVELLDLSEEEVVRLIRFDLELAAEDLRAIGGEAVTLADKLDAERLHPRTENLASD